MFTKLYIPSTKYKHLKKVLTKAIWADKKWTELNHETKQESKF